MDAVEAIRAKFSMLSGALDERARRLWAATEAAAFGRGGIAAVRRATGLAFETVKRGLADLVSDEPWPAGRVRRPGAGRKRSTVLDPKLKIDLDRLIDPVSRGDPESPLRWTSKSVGRLTRELRSTGHKTCETVVRGLLHDMGYSLQANRKTQEGAQHPDRDAQFQHINARVRAQPRAAAIALSAATMRRGWGPPPVLTT